MFNKTKGYMEDNFKPFPSVDKSKLFCNARPKICQRKSSSLGERSLNLRLLKIIQYTLKKIFKIAEQLKKNFFESAFKLIFGISAHSRKFSK